MWTVTDKFNAIGTSEKEYIILELTDKPLESSLNVEPPETPGARRYTLEDGSEVSARKDGTFIVINTDEVLKAVSPSTAAG